MQDGDSAVEARGCLLDRETGEWKNDAWKSCGLDGDGRCGGTVLVRMVERTAGGSAGRNDPACRSVDYGGGQKKKG